MRNSIPISAAVLFAGFSVASPAPVAQVLDFAQLAAATSVAQGPTGLALSQTVTVASTVIVTAPATASATGAAKRDLEKRNLLGSPTPVQSCNWVLALFKLCSTSTTSSSTSSSSSSSTSCSKTTSTMASTSVRTTSSSVSTSSSSSSSSFVPVTSSSSSSTVSMTVSATTSSTTACATTIENGTYCGFINPEDPCAPQPAGYGPVATPDTVSAFYDYAPFQSMASAAPTVIASSASGEEYIQTFADLNASVSASSYLGLYTLESYDTAGCAAYCDNTTLCTSFNIYIERDPSQNPTANDSTAATVWGYWCPDPASITNYKCTLWGSSINATEATNYGGWREEFEVVVTGSNGYDKTNSTTPSVTYTSGSSSTTAASTSTVSVSTLAATTISTKSTLSTSILSATATITPSSATWGHGTDCGKAAINNPSHCMGSKVFPGPYNPQICSDYVTSQNAVNKAAAIAQGLHSFVPSTFFNAYYLHKNGQPFGTYCTIFDSEQSVSYATYGGGFSGSDYYSCEQSWAFTLQTSAGFSSC